MTRRALLPALLAAAVLLLCACGSSESRTMKWFEDHREALSADAEARLAGEFSDVFDGDVWRGEHTIVEYCVPDGLTAQYSGVFYSPDDVPAAFQNVSVPLTETGDGEWIWCDRGDNHGLVRRIAEKWFYFEATF